MASQNLSNVQVQRATSFAGLAATDCLLFGSEEALDDLRLASGRLTRGAQPETFIVQFGDLIILPRGAYSLLEHFNGFPQSLQSCFFFLGVGNPAAVLLAVGVA